MSGQARQRGFGRHIDPHLVPFMPYVEKSDVSSEDQTMADSFSHPIKISTIKNWLQTCDSNHGSHCLTGGTSNLGRPLWLVDVKRRCIVPARDDFEYVTLSYVWGMAQPVVLTIENVETFLMQGSLFDVSLPRTILEAIDLVAILGLRYLWVDRLCIVQDDVPAKHSQLKAMAAIYANAYFTIVAAQGNNANGALAGGPFDNSVNPMALLPESIRNLPSRASKSMRSLLDTTAKSLKTLQSSGPLNSSPAERGADIDPWRAPTNHAAIMNWMAVDLISSPWFSRGWTLQEFIFSRRKLIFHRKSVNWECHCATWHELQYPLTTLAPCSSPPPNLSFLGLDITVWPNFHRYARLVCLFSLRSFTFPEDILDAFDGALTAFSKTYKGGLVTGLPQLMFDAALIWQPYNPLARRRPAALETADAVLPSWSWIGWLGNIQSESWRSGYDYVRRDPSTTFNNENVGASTWQTLSTVQWYHSSTVSSTRYPIQAVAAEYKKRYYHKLDAELLEGWSRHACEEAGKFYYSQDTLPGFEFWYPIPILDGASVPGRASRSRYIHCTTRRADLTLKLGTFRSACTASAAGPLEDGDGNVVGCLRLNSTVQGNRGVPPCVCQLIELSAGSVILDPSQELLYQVDADIFDEWHLPGWTQRDGLYEFYNVMWIEWEGDIAYRQAVGRVQKKAWDLVATQKVDITLG
jgi:hypothetical protein